MGLKPGYLKPKGCKVAGVGLIPEDWEERRLGESCELITKGTTPTSLGRAFVNTGINFLKAETLSENGGLIPDRLAYIDSTTHALLGRSQLVAGDLLISIAGVLGRVGIVTEADVPANTNQALAIIRIHKYSKVERGYLFHSLRSSIVSNQIRDINVQAAQANISLQNVRDFLIPIPPTKAEQEAIAEVLGDVDALIAALDRLIAKKCAIKQGAMQQLLTGKTRLPGFNREWNEKRLGNTAILKARIGWQGLTTAEYQDSGDYYLVTGTEFKDGYVDWTNCPFVDESRYKQDENIQLKQHDVLVTKDGTIGKVALVSSLPGPATLNSGVFVIRPLENAFFPEFFYHLLCSKVFTKFLAQLSAGSTISHLYQKDFVSFVYKTPTTIDEQSGIAGVLSAMDKEIAKLEARREKTSTLKQGLMQELLTGRIRLL